ncbi:MAG: hypothetical protein HFE71_09080 [Emergencia sp.]|nr:hypothetical protein [Emergencia sp.]
MRLTFERAVDGEITAGKDRTEWTPEGKPNRLSFSRCRSRGDGEGHFVTKVGI